MKMKKKLLKIIGAVVIGIVLLTVLVLLGFKLVDYVRHHDFYANAKPAFAMPGVGDDFVQQGFDYIPEEGIFLAAGYMNDGTASRVYVLYPDGTITYTALKKADGSDYKGHTGGIAHFGHSIYITGSDGIDVFSYDEILSGAESTKMLTTVATFNDPAYCYVQNGYLLSGAFYREGSHETAAYEHMTTPAGDQHRSIITVFKLEAWLVHGIDPTPVAVISTPDHVQGMCITEDGRVILSTSYGLSTSKLMVYDPTKIASSTVSFAGTTEGGEIFDFGTLPVYYLDSSSLVKIVKAPPMAEEMVWLEGKVYILNESASSKYIFGNITSGRKVYAYALDEK